MRTSCPAYSPAVQAMRVLHNQRKGRALLPVVAAAAAGSANAPRRARHAAAGTVSRPPDRFLAEILWAGCSHMLQLLHARHPC